MIPHAFLDLRGISDDCRQLIALFAATQMLQFRQEVFAVPYSYNPNDRDAYPEKITQLSKQNIVKYKSMRGLRIDSYEQRKEQHVIAYKLQKYIYPLRKIHPNSFLATLGERPKQSQQHRNLRATLEKIITSLQEGTNIALSDEEKQAIKKPYLLQLIPKKFKKN